MSSTTTAKKKGDGTSIGDAIFKSSFNDEDKILIDPNNKLQKSLLVAKRLSTEEDEMIEQIIKLRETVLFKPQKRIESLDAIAGLKYNLGRNYNELYGKTKIISSRDLALFKKNNKTISKIYIPNLQRSIYNIEAANSKPNRGKGASPYDQLAQRIQKIDIKTPEEGKVKKLADTFVVCVSFIIKPVLKEGSTYITQMTFTGVMAVSSFALPISIPGVVVGATGWFILGMGDYMQKVNADPLADDYDRRWQAVLSAGCGYMLLNMPIRTALPGLAGGVVASYAGVGLGMASQGLVKLAYPSFVSGIFIFDQKKNYDIKTAFIEGDDTYDIFKLWEAILKAEYEQKYEDKWNRSIMNHFIPKFVRSFFRRSTETIDYVAKNLGKEFGEALLGNAGKFKEGLPFGYKISSITSGTATALREFRTTFLKANRIRDQFYNAPEIGTKPLKWLGKWIPIAVATCLDAVSKILFTIYDNISLAAAILTAIVWVPLLTLWLDTQYGGEILSTSVNWLNIALTAILDIVLTRDFFSDVFKQTAMPVASGFLSNYMKNHLDSFVGMVIVSAGLSTVTNIDITNTNAWIPIVLSSIPLLAPYMAPKNVMDKYNNMRSSTFQGIESQLYNFYYRTGLLDFVVSLETRTDDIPFLHMGLDQALTMYIVDGLAVDHINNAIVNIYDMSVDRGIDYLNSESVIELAPINPKEAQQQLNDLKTKNEEYESAINTNKQRIDEINQDLPGLYDRKKNIKEDQPKELADIQVEIATAEKERDKLIRDNKNAELDKGINDKIAGVINDAVKKAKEAIVQPGDKLPADAEIKFEPVFKRRGIINEGINMWLDAHYWWRKDTAAPKVLNDFADIVERFKTEGEGENLRQGVEDLKVRVGNVKDAEIKPNVFEITPSYAKSKGLSLENLNYLKENYDQKEVDKARQMVTEDRQNEKMMKDFCDSRPNTGCASKSVIEDAFVEKREEVARKVADVKLAANQIDTYVKAIGLDKLGIVAVREFNASINLTKEQRIKYAGVIREAGNVSLITQYARGVARQVEIRVGTVYDAKGVARQVPFEDGTMFIDSKLREANEQLGLFRRATDEEGAFLYHNENTNEYIISDSDPNSDPNSESGSGPGPGPGQGFKPVDMDRILELKAGAQENIFALENQRVITELGTDVNLNVLDTMDREIRLKMASFQNTLKKSVNMSKSIMEKFLVRDRKYISLDEFTTKPIDFIFNNAWGKGWWTFSPAELVVLSGSWGFSLMTLPSVVALMAMRGINDASVNDIIDHIPYYREIAPERWQTFINNKFQKAQGIRVFQFTWPVIKLARSGWNFSFTDMFKSKSEKDQKKVNEMKNKLLLLKARLFNIGRTKAKLSKQKEIVANAADGKDKEMVDALIDLQLKTVEAYRETVISDFGDYIYRTNIEVSGKSETTDEKQKEAAQGLAYLEAFDMATQVDLDFAFAYSLDIDIDIDITMAYQYDSPPVEEEDGEAKAKGDKPPLDEPDDNVVSSGYRFLTKSSLGVNLKDETGKLKDLIPKQVQDIWRRMVDDYADTEEARQFFESNMLWLGMYAEPSVRLKEHKVDPNMMLAMLRKVQFERISDRALTSDEFNYIINRETAAENAFYKAMEGKGLYEMAEGIFYTPWRDKQYNPIPKTIKGEQWVARYVDQKEFDKPELQARITEQPWMYAGLKEVQEGIKKHVYYEKFSDVYGVGTGDAIRVKDETLLQIVNYEKAEGDKFTSVAQYYKALDDPSQSERTAVRWNNIYLLDLFSENRPGMDVNFVPILREHEKDVLNYDFDKKQEPIKKSLEEMLQKLVVRIPNLTPELASVVEELSNTEDRVLDVTSSGYKVDGQVGTRFEQDINIYAAEIGAERVGQDIIQKGVYGAAGGGTVYNALKKLTGNPLGAAGFVWGGATGLAVGAGIHFGWTKDKVRVNNVVVDDGSNTGAYYDERGIYTKQFAEPTIANSEPGSFESEFWANARNVRAFNQILLGLQVLAEEKGIRVGAGASVGLRRDIGQKEDVKVAVNESIKWQEADNAYYNLKDYLRRNEYRVENEREFLRVIGGQDFKVSDAERNGQTLNEAYFKSDWRVNYELAEKFRDIYAKKDELNLVRFRKNEVMKAKPETVIDESYVLGQRNLVKNFLANKYFAKFVEKGNLRSELRQYAEF
jgi:hypothetical protein